MLGTITLTVGQTDAMPQIEEVPEMTEVGDEVSPKVNGEKEASEAADGTPAAEEKAAEEKPDEANEVGFKKIFRFVGFKFTLKKDKSEKAEPVRLLTVKETDDGAVEKPEGNTEEGAEVGRSESGDEVKTDDAGAVNGGTEAPTEDAPASDAKAETVGGSAEENPAEEQPVVEEVVTSTEKEKEAEVQAEPDPATAGQEVQSPLKRFFTQGIFSNLRKKTSFKKSKEDEPAKEKPAEEDIKEAEEKVDGAAAEGEQVEEVAKEEEADEEAKMPEGPEKAEASQHEASPVTKEQEEKRPDLETKEDHEIAPEGTSETASCEAPEEPTADSTVDAKTTEESAEEQPEKSPTEEQPEKSPTEEQPEKSPTEEQPQKSPTEEQPEKPSADPTEAEALSSQEKAKAQVSPLKKLFAGTGLKKLSSKKQKGKKEPDPKPAEPEPEQAAEVPDQPADEASSPEGSGEHDGDADEPQAEDEAATSDSEKKKDGILPWASFKKLVTPKKRVKRASDSDEEAPADKPKSATLSSTESAGLDEKTEDVKPSETVVEEAKEESQAESKTETKAEKPEQGTEEPKRKMDTSVSWEALICVGSAKKRARKTSDSDEEEEAKIEEGAEEEERAKAAESPLTASVEAERENPASSPEPEGELVSTWESFKRLVTQRKRPKTEDRPDDSSAPEQATSDSEAPKEESSFSLRKLIPRRKKKPDGKRPASGDLGSAEEDSDTPAVVPLSEYDPEQSEEVSPEGPEDPKPDVTAVTPGRVAAEDRSPSWISTTVEGSGDDPDAKLLSDIPEEGDAATPRSADNTVGDEVVELTSEAVTAREPAEETEMVSALSRVTGSPVTSGEASPVPGEFQPVPEVVLRDVVETITATSTTMAATAPGGQASHVAFSDIPLPVEAAVREEEAEPDVAERVRETAVCSGLEMNQESGIQEVSLEPLSAVSEALCVEVAPEDHASKPEEAVETEDKVCEVQVHEVRSVCKEEAAKDIEAVIESVARAETEGQEVAVAAVQQEAEVIEGVVEAENTPTAEPESPIKPTVEEPVCDETAGVTEVAVAEAKEVQGLEAVGESIAVVEEAPVVEATTTLPDEPVSVPAVSQEAPVPVASAVPEEVCVSPVPESETEEVTAAVSVEDSVRCASSSVTAVEGTSEEVQEDAELSRAELVTETQAIQEQSTVIVREVIQNVVENLEVLESTATVTEATPSEIRDGEEAETDAPAEAEEPSEGVRVPEEQEPVTEETGNDVEQEQTQTVDEKSPASASKDAQNSGTGQEIPEGQVAASSVTVDTVTCEAKAEEEVGAASEEGTSEVEPATAETRAQSESDPVSAVVPEVVRQQVQGTGGGTTRVVDDDEEDKDDAEEGAAKSLQGETTPRVPEEARKEVSAKDIKGDEGSGDGVEVTTNAEEAGSAATTEVTSMS